MPRNEVSYLVFDIESVADADLVAAIRHPEGEIASEDALRQYRDELMEKKGSDFIPYTFQVPVSLALAKVSADFTLLDLKVLGGSPENICKKFWSGWLHYQKPTLVTFNGRGFDIPLMELTAFRYGMPIPEWFAWGARAYDQPRNRYNLNNHIDLCDFLTNSGAVSFTGGLNIASKIIKKPGKIDTHGDMVQDMIDAGRIEEVHQYCRCDVLDTYFVFLRSMLICGRISVEDERALIGKTKIWLQNNAAMEPVYQRYLDVWEEMECGSFSDQGQEKSEQVPAESGNVVSIDNKIPVDESVSSETEPEENNAGESLEAGAANNDQADPDDSNGKNDSDENDVNSGN